MMKIFRYLVCATAVTLLAAHMASAQNAASGANTSGSSAPNGSSTTGNSMSGANTSTSAAPGGTPTPSGNVNNRTTSGANNTNTTPRSTPRTGATRNSNATIESETNYWRNNYSTRPYVNRTMKYDTYAPAYRYGVETYSAHNGRRFEDISDAQLRQGWENMRGNSTMEWNQARDAARDAYNRLYNQGVPDSRSTTVP